MNKKGISPNGQPLKKTKFEMESEEVLFQSFFYFAGISTLFVWNSVLSLTAYWAGKFRTGVASYYSFYFFIGSLANFFVFDYINSRVIFIRQAMLWPT